MELETEDVILATAIMKVLDPPWHDSSCRNRSPGHSSCTQNGMLSGTVNFAILTVHPCDAADVPSPIVESKYGRVLKTRFDTVYDGRTAARQIRVNTCLNSS